MRAETEPRILELLRDRYEREGYAFALRPAAAKLPPFMAGYQPDAIATKGDLSIAIEVTTRRAKKSTGRLRDLPGRFKGQAKWQFHVVYAEDVEPEPAPAPTRADILLRLTAIEAMAANDNPDAALVLAWAALEAAARSVADEAQQALPTTAREALQILEYLGRIDYPTAESMRRSLDLRNQIVHGDLTARVAPAVVTELVNTVRAALAA